MNTFKIWVAIGSLLLLPVEAMALGETSTSDGTQETIVHIDDVGQIERFDRIMMATQSSSIPGLEPVTYQAGAYACTIIDPWSDTPSCGCENEGCDLMISESVCQSGSVTISQVPGYGIFYGQTVDKGSCLFDGTIPLAVQREYNRARSSFGQETALSSQDQAIAGSVERPTRTRRDHRSRPARRDHRSGG